MAEQRDLSAITLPEAPIGELDSFDEQVKLMFDLLALAYTANLTRVASYIMVAEGTNRTYNHIGVSDAFHPLSHHANDRERLLKLARIQKYHVERFADFVAKLAATPDGDGSLLDHSLFMYGSNMSNSDRHNNYPLPNILVGGANGRLKGGQQVELPEHTPLTNLLLTVLNKAGLEMKSFADSTGEIARRRSSWARRWRSCGGRSRSADVRARRWVRRCPGCWDSRRAERSSGSTASPFRPRSS
jgi:hypothetical protein